MSIATIWWRGTFSCFIHSIHYTLYTIHSIHNTDNAVCLLQNASQLSWPINWHLISDFLSFSHILLDHPRLWAALCSWPQWVTCRTPTYCRPQRVGGARRTSSSRGVRLTGSTTTATTRDISINISNLQSYEDWIIFTENGFTFILVLVILDRVWYKRPRCLSDVNCVPHTNHHHNFLQIPATRDTKLTWRTNWLLKILSHLKCKVFYIKFIFWFI